MKQRSMSWVGGIWGDLRFSEIDAEDRGVITYKCLGKKRTTL